MHEWFYANIFICKNRILYHYNYSYVYLQSIHEDNFQEPSLTSITTINQIFLGMKHEKYIHWI